MANESYILWDFFKPLWGLLAHSWAGPDPRIDPVSKRIDLGQSRLAPPSAPFDWILDFSIDLESLTFLLSENIFNLPIRPRFVRVGVRFR